MTDLVSTPAGAGAVPGGRAEHAARILGQLAEAALLDPNHGATDRSAGTDGADTDGANEENR